jgi:hypothetical protein
MKKILIASLLIIPFLAKNIYAQDSQTDRNVQKIEEKGVDTKFLLTGYGFAGFEKIGDENSTFGPAGFSPIFLWKKSDHLFFESEAEFEIEDGKLNIGLEYATLHYKVNKYFTFSAGKFLSPFGIFTNRLHPAWINKFAEKPLGFSEKSGMIGPMAEFGASIRGGTQLGGGKINYIAYISNGPKLNSGDKDPLEAGKLEYDNLGDNNNNKAVGGRIGLLPFSNSSLEIGFSGQYAGVGDEKSTYKNVASQMYAGDFSLIQKIDFLKSNVDIKAQYNLVNVSKTNYTDTLTNSYSFNNNSTAWFAQLAIRPAFLEKGLLKKVEFAGRYSAMKTPEKAFWGTEKSVITAGVNYWLAWNSVIKFNYQIEKRMGAKYENGFIIQWGLGF